MSEAENKLKAHCNSCGGERNHIVLCVEIQKWADGDHPENKIYGEDQFKLLKCAGCGSVKILHQDWFSEVRDEFGEPIITVTYYPPAISRSEPRWLSQLRFPFWWSKDQRKDPQYVAALLAEVYSALHNGSRRLAVMGSRALLEHMMIAKVGDKGSFKKNLDEFQAKGHMSSDQRKSVERIVEAGHATIHRGFDPSVEDVDTVIDITQSLVETIYIHEKKTSELFSRVPPRDKNGGT